MEQAVGAHPKTGLSTTFSSSRRCDWNFVILLFLALQVLFIFVYLTFVQSAPKALKELFPPLNSIFKSFKSSGREDVVTFQSLHFPKALGGGQFVVRGAMAGCILSPSS